MDDIRSWWEVPSIAHFCSLFRAAFDLTDFDIEDLEDALLDSEKETGSEFIQDLVCRMLNGCYGRKDISSINWDLYVRDIIKYKWEVADHPIRQKEHFQQLTLREKVEVIHAICEFRLDAEDVFELIKGFEGDNMRVEPLGRDREGGLYWYFYGSRLYREDPEPKKAVTKEEKRSIEKARKKQLKRQRIEEKRQRKHEKSKKKVKQKQEKKRKCSVEEEEDVTGDVRRSGRLRTKRVLRKQQDSESEEPTSSSVEEEEEEEESSEDTVVEAAADIVPVKLSAEDRKRPFVCQMSDCSKRYTDRSSCRKHMKTVHPKEYAKKKSAGGISWKQARDAAHMQRKPSINCSSKAPAKGGKTPQKPSSKSTPKATSASKQRSTSRSAKKETPGRAEMASSRRSTRLRQKAEVEESDKSDNDDDEGFEDEDTSDSDSDDKSIVSETSRKSTRSDMSRRSSKSGSSPLKRVKPFKKPACGARKGSPDRSSLDCKNAVGNESGDSSDSVADMECVLCGREDGDDCMLLCDECDCGYHTYCLTPPLAAIPPGNWSCLACVSETEMKFEKKTEPKARSTIKTEQPVPMDCTDDDDTDKADNCETDPELEQVVMQDKDKTLEHSPGSGTTDEHKIVLDDADVQVGIEPCDSKCENDQTNSKNDETKSNNETECDTTVDSVSSSEVKTEQHQHVKTESDDVLSDNETDKHQSSDKEITSEVEDEEKEAKADVQTDEGAIKTVSTAGTTPPSSTSLAASFADAFLRFTQPIAVSPADEKPNTGETKQEPTKNDSVKCTVPENAKNDDVKHTDTETTKTDAIKHTDTETTKTDDVKHSDPETTKTDDVKFSDPEITKIDNVKHTDAETTKIGNVKHTDPKTTKNDNVKHTEPETTKSTIVRGDPETAETDTLKPLPHAPTPWPSCTRWHVVCSTLADWDNLMEWFRESPAKCERTLSRLVREDFLPILPEIIESREKERRRRQREQELRKSTRITFRMQEKLEQERILADAMAEEDKARAACEEEKRVQEEQDRIAEENRLREERARAREERAKRMSMREERARLTAEGKVIPPELIYTGLPAQRYKDDVDSDDNKSDMLNAESFEALLKVVHGIQNHKEAWPFLDPVNEDEAPGYHDVIKRPMDLSKIEKKIQLKEYRTQHHFLADFRLMFKNCSRFNGADSEFTTCARSLEKALKNLVKKHLQDETSDVYAQDGDFVMSVSKVKIGEKRFRPRRAASSRALQTVQRAFESSEEDDLEDMEPLVVRQKVEGHSTSRHSTSLLLQEMIELKRAREKIAKGTTDDQVVVRGRPPPNQQSPSPGVMVIPKSEAATTGILGNSTTREIRWNIQQRQQKLTSVENVRSRIQLARQQAQGTIVVKDGTGGDPVPLGRPAPASRVIKIMAASGGSSETSNQAVRNAAENVKVSADGFLIINGKNSGIKVTPNTKIVIQPPGTTPPSLASLPTDVKEDGLVVKKIPTPSGLQPLILSTSTTLATVTSTASPVANTGPAISNVLPNRIPVPSILNQRPPAPVTGMSLRPPTIVNVNGSQSQAALGQSQPVRAPTAVGQIPAAQPGLNTGTPSPSKPLTDLEAKKKTFDIAQRLLALNMKRKLAGANCPLSPQKMMKIDAENLVRTTETVYKPTNIDNDIKTVSSNVVKAVNIAGDILDSYYAALSGQPTRTIQPATTKSSVIISSANDVSVVREVPTPASLTSPLSGGSVVRATDTMMGSGAVLHTPITTVSSSNGVISSTICSNMQYIVSAGTSQMAVPNVNTVHTPVKLNVHHNINQSSMKPLIQQPLQSNPTGPQQAVVQRLAAVPGVHHPQSVPGQAVTTTPNPSHNHISSPADQLSPIEALYMGQNMYHVTNPHPAQNAVASFPAMSSPSVLSSTQGNRPALFDIFEPDKKQSLTAMCEDDFGFATLTERSPPKMMSLARQLESKSTITQGSPVRAASVLQALKSKLAPSMPVPVSRVAINTQDQYLNNPQHSSTNFCTSPQQTSRDVYKLPVPQLQATQLPSVNSTVHLTSAVNTRIESAVRYPLHGPSGNSLQATNPVLHHVSPTVSQTVSSPATVTIQHQCTYQSPSVLVSPLSPAQQDINTNMMLADHTAANRLESLPHIGSVLHNSLPTTDPLQSQNIVQTQHVNVNMNNLNSQYYTQTNVSQLGNSVLNENQSVPVTQLLSPVQQQTEIGGSTGLQNNMPYTAMTMSQVYTQMASQQYTTPLSPQHYSHMAPKTVQVSTRLSEVSPTMQINPVQGSEPRQFESLLVTPMEQESQRSEVEPMINMNSW